MAEPAALRPANADRIVCDLGTLTKPDLQTVDALARLARSRRGWTAGSSCCHAPAAVRELIGLAGLSEVLPCPGDSGVEARR